MQEVDARARYVVDTRGGLCEGLELTQVLLVKRVEGRGGLEERWLGGSEVLLNLDLHLAHCHLLLRGRGCDLVGLGRLVCSLGLLRLELGDHGVHLDLLLLYLNLLHLELLLELAHLAGGGLKLGHAIGQALDGRVGLLTPLSEHGLEERDELEEGLGRGPVVPPFLLDVEAAGLVDGHEGVGHEADDRLLLLGRAQVELAKETLGH
mmetsp:Transcript_14862/g.36098  ORF Transcript_14862/g.36098 Transcript_14862/m.36098 type:complete len:207 (-) Transcript_14862:4075-4695(-)